MVIDKNRIYELGDYKFKNFINLTDEEIRSVWKWRNDDAIRKYMYNSDIIPFENHINFVASLKDRRDVAYWAVYRKGRIVGVTNLTSISWDEEKAELGYYMIPEMLNSGIGLDFAYSNVDFAFSIIGIKSLFGGIDKRNINAIMLDSYLGCKLNEEDIENLSNIKYIRWVVTSEEFIANKTELNNIRNFVRYMKVRKDLFKFIKENA